MKFSWKNQHFIQNCPNFSNFLRNLLILSHYTANLQPSAVFDESRFFTENPSFFPKLLNFFESFEKSFYYYLIIQQICYLQPSMMNQIFFQKTFLFFQNCSSFSNFLSNVFNFIAFYSKLATSTIFQKIMILFQKPSFYFKKPDYLTFWKNL